MILFKTSEGKYYILVVKQLNSDCLLNLRYNLHLAITI